MLNFEERKILEYVLNCSKKREYVKQFSSNLSKWLSANLSYFTSNDKKAAAQKKISVSNSIFDDDDFDDIDFDEESSVNKGSGDISSGISLLKQTLEKFKDSKTSLLERNLLLLQKSIGLDDVEKEILGLAIRIVADNVKKNVIKQLFPFNLVELKKFFYCLPYKESVIYNKLKIRSKLSEFGILELYFRADITVNKTVFNLMFHNNKSVEDIKKNILGNPTQSKLQWSDFNHVEQKDLCRKLLSGILKKSVTGGNILIYGKHGCGKTEFAKILTKQANALGYILENNNISFSKYDCERSRIKNLLFVQKILQNYKNSVLIIDECDDIFNSFSNEKYFLNKLLEDNSTPCIYIMNSINFMDKAYLIRFTHAIKFEMPNLEVRTQMWQHGLDKYKIKTEEGTAKKFAEEYQLSPSFIYNAVKCAKIAGGGLNTIKQNLTALETAYNNGMEIKHETTTTAKPETEKNKNVFNTSLLNTDLDLSDLTQRICQLNEKSFSLCLYGVSGTGKSAYAEYLAEMLKMPVIKKNCSDLLSKMVGDSEKNIAEAFNEAKTKKAVLVFDEADSFLQDRKNAYRSWEVTQVNEMLTQMEKHPFPFVCTTNLIESLDKACLRRFIFKVEYKYLTDEQKTLAFNHFFNMKDVVLPSGLCLTPGDFAVVYKKASILGLLDNKNELIAMLETEVKNKDVEITKQKIGFI